MTDILWQAPELPLTAQALERERRRILARFLTTVEDYEACQLLKPVMEQSLLRTGYGECDGCQTRQVLHRYEIDEKHLEGLTCVDGLDGGSGNNNGHWICDGHLHGTLPEAAAGCDHGDAWCVDPENETERFEECPIAWWLSYTPHVPWLCPRCWKRLVDDEAEHVAALAAPQN